MKVVNKYWVAFDKNITAATDKVLRAFHVELTPPTLAKVVQFFKFGMAGLFNTIAYYVVYALCLLIGGRDHYVWANALGFIANVLSAFFWNYRYVFEPEEGEKRNKWRALLRTFVTYGFSGLIINNVMLYVWIDIIHISSYVGPIINLFITVPFNFIVNKFWACRGVKN